MSTTAIAAFATTQTEHPTAPQRKRSNSPTVEEKNSEEKTSDVYTKKMKKSPHEVNLPSLALPQPDIEPLSLLTLIVDLSPAIARELGSPAGGAGPITIEGDS